MKFFNLKLLLLVIAFSCLLSFTIADDEANKPRIAPRRPPGKGPKSTTTTPPPEEDAEYPEELQENDYEGEDGQGSSTTTTSTEPPRKVGPVIRPFRSNDDFLNSLKRRQMNAIKHKSEKPTPKSKPIHDDQGDDSEESAPAPVAASPKNAKPSLVANRRKFIKPGKPEPPAEDTAAEGSEQEQEDSKPKRPNPRLALRKRL